MLEERWEMLGNAGLGTGRVNCASCFRKASIICRPDEHSNTGACRLGQNATNSDEVS